MKRSKRIILAALLAGTLDGLAATMMHFVRGGNNPEIVFRFIASGIFGNSAFSVGPEMTLAGLLFHYFIAVTWTILFFKFYPGIRPQWSNKHLSGIVYGIFIWLVMNLVVLPLSNTPPAASELSQDMIGILIIVVTVGLPISYMEGMKK